MASIRTLTPTRRITVYWQCRIISSMARYTLANIGLFSSSGSLTDSNNFSRSIPAKYMCQPARSNYGFTSRLSPSSITRPSFYSIAWRRWSNVFSAYSYTGTTRYNKLLLAIGLHIVGGICRTSKYWDLLP